MALVQAETKINKFQAAVREVLVKLDPGPKKILKISNIQDAINAILDDYKEQGPANVVIFGYGKPGHLKVGEDILEHETPEGQANQ